MYLKTKTMFTYKIYSCHAVTAVLKYVSALWIMKSRSCYFLCLVGGERSGVLTGSRNPNDISRLNF
jgi:hypothetical protein